MPWSTRSISHAVWRMRARSMAASVCSSARGNWMAWFAASDLPKTRRSLAYLAAVSMQYCAAPREDAAWRIRFSCTNSWATCRPLSTGPSTSSVRTRTLVNDTRAWSVGMLKVQ